MTRQNLITSTLYTPCKLGIAMIKRLNDKKCIELLINEWIFRFETLSLYLGFPIGIPLRKMARNYRAHNRAELQGSQLRGITGLTIARNYRAHNCAELQGSQLREITGLTTAWNYRAHNCAELQGSQWRGITGLTIARNYRAHNCAEVKSGWNPIFILL